MSEGKSTANSVAAIEAKWRREWEERGTYRFDRTKPRSEVFSIDTPPPTVSGALHPGHCFSYTHTDIIARYQRMRGKEVFYPMGWDDNGLNTERRVQLMLGVACDPSLPYDPDFRVPDKRLKPTVAISRPNFVECCAAVTELLEKQYFELWSALGLSVDWTQTYTTVGKHAIHTSQYAFLELLGEGLTYRTESPTLWDVDFRTAVAQAELQDRDIPGAFHRLRFRAQADGSPIGIETTRPELLPACVALVAHPDDGRYQHLFGSKALSPLFDVAVPVVAHELAEPGKGSGIAMICTFGDTTDVIWWRELKLALRVIVDKAGRITHEMPQGIVSERGQQAYAQLAGKKVAQARETIVALLAASGELEGEPRPMTHPVKHWENGTKPLEIVTSRQWFIRYPSKGDMLERGEQLRWVPEHMRARYEDWVSGLMGDWNITRQRFFGVPFPVWYPIELDGTVAPDRPIVASAEELPVDPSVDVPKGFTADQRDVPGGFTADPDVMDTWATSSLTPQIAGHWIDDEDLWQRVYPMDLRPQAHEIIRTWLFYTIVRSHYSFGTLPWRTTAISGFVYDPDRKKLSKSADNSPDTPTNLIASFGADAVRYWAAGGRPGLDLAIDRNQFKIGRKLVVKLLNVAKFIGGFDAPRADASTTHPLDAALLQRLEKTVAEASTAFESYDYTKALVVTETFFWSFCDDFVELVKSRAYQQDSSALATLRCALDVVLALFAPFLPFVTEEVWSQSHDDSIHRSRWPDSDALGARPEANVAHLDAATTLLHEIRKAKSAAKVSLRTAVSELTVHASADHLHLLRAVIDDIREAGNVAKVSTLPSDNGLRIDVELEPAATG
ncbi:MAG: valine--tRNA ligase [Pseudonocardiales bacterium]|nr:valine--tRNA ligase [Pseudonocardiales bacterium]MBV9729120.1 valine--tRNA ligase [Pseudonocardiales bacterium]